MDISTCPSTPPFQQVACHMKRFVLDNIGEICPDFAGFALDSQDAGDHARA